MLQFVHRIDVTVAIVDVDITGENCDNGLGGGCVVGRATATRQTGYRSGQSICSIFLAIGLSKGVPGRHLSVAVHARNHVWQYVYCLASSSDLMRSFSFRTTYGFQESEKLRRLRRTYALE
jgi:hypothetical protein